VAQKAPEQFNNQGQQASEVRLDFGEEYSIKNPDKHLSKWEDSFDSN